MRSLGNKVKSIESIFEISSSIKSSLSELKKRNINKRKKYVKNLITSKGNTTKNNNKNDAIKNPFDSKGNTTKISNKYDAIKNPFSSKNNTTKINNKNDVLKNLFDSKAKANKNIFGLKKKI